jgi:hypothetical protein
MATSTGTSAKMAKAMPVRTSKNDSWLACCPSTMARYGASSS